MSTVCLEAQPAVTTTSFPTASQTVCCAIRKPPKHIKHDSFSLNCLPLSLSFSPLPEPFEEDVKETDSFPPNLPKIPTTSSSPPPVTHTSSSPTSSHSSSNTTAGPSGESGSRPLRLHPPALQPLHLLVSAIFLSTDHSFSVVYFHHPLHPPLLAALSCLSNSPDLSLITSRLRARLFLSSCDECEHVGSVSKPCV